MKHDCLVTLAVLVASQLACAQVPCVSMGVTASTGSVGTMCENFACLPHLLVVPPGDDLLIEMYGAADRPYILFAGDWAPSCVPLGWVLGALASAPPYLVLDIGVVPNSGFPSKCGLDTATAKLSIPSTTPMGTKIVLQTAAWQWKTDLPAFSRGVMLGIK